MDSHGPGGDLESALRYWDRAAAGQVLRTALTTKGVQARAESRPGPRATFESEVQMTGRRDLH
jgi:hypothetical protein